MGDPPCPLCAGRDTREVLADVRGSYHECRRCGLVYLHPDARPTPLAEVTRYLEHRNDAADQGYRRFLRRLADPLAARLRPGARGLDFGCGPVPVLAEILAEAGFPTASYDPVFRPDEHLLDATYDFVTCCEVLEHVHDPPAALATFARLLARGGTLGVMTRFPGEAPLASWWYRRDPTHVCFYGEATMRRIAADRGWAVEVPAADVAIFTVPACHAP